MQDNQKKYRKKYAVMTVFFLISASFLFWVREAMIRPFLKQKNFYFLRKKKVGSYITKERRASREGRKKKGGSGQRYSGRKSGA